MAAKRRAARDNQRYRTRKDLLEAAARLMKDGANPGMDAVAAAARVSRATAYRYFPSLDALLAEAPLDGAVPAPDDLFARETSADPEERVDRAEAAMHEMVYRNEAQLRRMLAHLVALPEGRHDTNAVPRRQNRRIPLIEKALAPARKRFRKADYDRLCAALALIFGTESMVVFRDVLQMDEAQARKVKSWAVRALVRAALREAKMPVR